jgi:hypothetical protein
MAYTRKYFYQITDDRQTIIIGTEWSSETNQLNQIGTITKTIGNPYLMNFNFKLENGQTINLEGATIDEVLDSIKDYLSKDDVLGLCPFLMCWN